jgi:hypothetical protein
MTSSLQAIPEGSWILAIGANGFITSHIILEFLKLGYKVRGTVRGISVSAWLTEELFQSYTANCSFELITFPDMAAENAFNDTIKDVSGVVQVAFVLCTISTQITPFLKCIRNSQPSASVRERPFSQAIRTDIFYGCSCYAGRESE